MSRNILLADDSLTIQKVVELTFMEGDFQVTAVSNGDDALAKLEETAPDIVIADVHMPGADGYRICRTSKERYSGVPVLLLVGTFEPFEESTAADCGADAHLKKPFDSQELLRLVESLLEGSAAAAGDREEPVEEGAEAWSPKLGAEEGFSPAPDAFAAAEDSGVGYEDSFTEAAAPPEPSSQPEISGAAAGDGLSDAEVDRIARRVVELISDQVLREISWDVVPDLAEIVIKERIRELESQVE